VFALLGGTTVSEAVIPTSERNALIALYDNTGGPGWNDSTNWLGAAGTECTWFGVVCSGGDAHVVELNLAGNHLVGTIPPQVGDLTELDRLSFSFNELTGTIPPEIGSLSLLVRLGLSNNQLFGPIPPELGSLAALERIWLNHNQLSGSIPTSFGGLTSLTRLNLENNRLTGSIPVELATMAALEEVSLWGNDLSGEIPAGFAGLPLLTVVDLAGNELSGSIPPEFGGCPNLNLLILVDNQLEGEIPPELGQLANLGHLDLAVNQLSGSIPPELGSLANLGFLALSDNRLTGPIPPELGSLPNLTDLHLQNNGLSGPIPPELGGLSALGALILHDNNLTGPLPPELGGLGSLGHMDLARNHLTGPIPGAFGGLVNLGFLNLEGNALSGPIPPEIGLLGNLGELILGWNQLNGAIPPEIGSLGSLWGLALNHNRLEGPIPTEFGNLGNLQWMNLAANRLMGPVPPSITSLGALWDNSSDIAHNGLYSGDPGVVGFLDAKCGPEWKDIQTVVPNNLGVVHSTGLSITLGWDPIPYAWNAGGYDIFLSESPSGPFLHSGRAVDKRAGSWTIYGLLPGMNYYFQVESVTEAGPENPNTVISERSSWVSGSTTGSPSTWYVAPTGLVGNDCESPATPCPTIMSALGLAGPAEMVHVAAGTYAENFFIDEPVMLVGEDPATTVVVGHGGGPVIDINSGVHAAISGLTIRNGESGHGGGVFAAPWARLELEDSVITENWAAEHGGGIFVDCDASAVLDRVSIAENASNQFAGGLGACGSIVLRDSEVSLNSARWGGGIATHGNTMIDRTTIADNTATHYGGGGVLNEAVMQISSSTVSGNSASHGGGLANQSGANMIVETTTVSGNTGGGVFNDRGGMVGLDGCTVADNSGAAAEHSGVMNWEFIAVHNTILAGNSPVNCANPVTTFGYNLEDKEGCGFDGPGDQSNTDPLLGPLADNGGSTQTHALSEGSPAIDAGDPAAFLSPDQRGHERPVDGDFDGVAVADIGSVEFVGRLFDDDFESGDTTAWAETSP
jgi:Leucine-rich repeat (LRR) protein